MMHTLKRYWSAEPKPPFKTPNGKAEWESFDAKLTSEDIIEMQAIDADCNDCLHFLRGDLVKVPGLKMFLGTCKKTGQPTKAFPMQYSGHECFEHRRHRTK